MTNTQETPAAANDRGSEEHFRRPQHSAPAARFAWEKRLRRDTTVTWAARSTGLLLATYANKDGSNARPGLPRLMEDSGLCKRAVQNHLTELLRRGYLIKSSTWTPAEQKAGKLANVYQLGLPVAESQETEAPKGASGDAEGCISKGASDCTPPDQPSPDHSQSTVPQGKPAGSSLRDDRDDDSFDILERIEQAVGGFEGGEESTADGMLADGRHPAAIINKIRADRSWQPEPELPPGPCPYECVGGTVLNGNEMAYCPRCRPKQAAAHRARETAA